MSAKNNRRTKYKFSDKRVKKSHSNPIFTQQITE